MVNVDCRGLSCPEPVIKTKKALNNNPEGIIVLLDNRVSYENVTRFASAIGYTTESREENGEWIMEIRK